MNETPLGMLKTVDPRSVWKNEEKDFTPWVAKNLDAISRVIGIPLVPEETEKRVGAYELDIFARVDGSEKAVIIENQLEQTDHRHLGQVVTYAAGLDAAVVIWIAPYISDEHRAAIEWLNRIAKNDISFFLLRAELIQIDDSRPAARFYLESGPSQFGRALIEAVDEGDAPRHSFRRVFWAALFAFLASKGHSWAEGRKAPKDSWITSSIGRSGIGVNVSMASGSRMRVEIYVYRDEGKEIFDSLYVEKDAIEKEFPEDTVSWERLDDGMASRVAVYHQYDKEKVSSESPDRTQLFIWIEARISVMRKVAQKYLIE
jgi:hypothetical protein